MLHLHTTARRSEKRMRVRTYWLCALSGYSLQGGAVGGGCSGWGWYYIVKWYITPHESLHPVSTAPPFAECRAMRSKGACRHYANTVGFHNFNLRIFNLRVSNQNKLIVDDLLTRCRISMCQGLGPKKHDEISEIDRTLRMDGTRSRCMQMTACDPGRMHVCAY